MTPDDSENADKGKDGSELSPLDDLLLLQAESVGELVNSQRRRRGVDARHAMIEAEDRALQAPNETDIEVPSSQQALGTKLESSNLSIGQLSTHLIGHTNVGSILTYKQG